MPSDWKDVYLTTGASDGIMVRAAGTTARDCGVSALNDKYTSKFCVLPEHPEAAGVGSRHVSDRGDDSHPAVSALFGSHLRAGGRADQLLPR